MVDFVKLLQQPEIKDVLSNNLQDQFAGYWTVEEASRFLTCPQPVDLRVLQQLGKDASLYCRIHGVAWQDKPVVGKRWPSERAYTLSVIREVFRLHPAVRDYVPADSE